MKVIRIFWALLLAGILFVQPLFAQNNLPKKSVRIGLLLPLLLDSAIDQENNFKFPPKTFPKYLLPGLEFYEGALLALDSLNKKRASVQLVVLDTRAAKQTIQEQLEALTGPPLDLLLTHCNATELRIIAAYGLKKNIPVVNVNLPNDAGITENPFLVLLNSTLRTQCIALADHIQFQYPKQQVVVFRKKGVLEDRIRSYWEEQDQTKKNTKWSYVDLPDSFSINQLSAKLDTLKPTICISGTLDEEFGKRMAEQLATLSNQRYKASLFGLPTLGDNKDFSKPAYSGIAITYCTPYYNPRTDSVSQQVQQFFSTNLYARPSDMVLRGFEAVWKYANLLLKYPNNIASHLDANEFELFRQLQIKRVIGKEKKLDYFENKKLYFLKWQDGILKLVS
ncbi:MAG: hypothetical protein FJY19_05545 [Bacteroidetes bacterium]|nr:hypothetical protein [Bacteroidota bacterium]